MLYFIWYLLALPHIHTVCTYWTDAAPTRAQLLAAGCADYVYYAIDERQYYIDLTGYDYEQAFYTTEEASGITTIHRRMENEVLCVVTVAHEGQPTDAELWEKCSYRWDLLEDHTIEGWELAYTYTVDLPPACTLPPVDNSAPLATENEYTFLAGRLSWWGLDSTPVDWQNRFDDSIRAAADAADIPAALLKTMLAAESQFWPLWTGDAGEIGMIQLTWDGADTVLRYSPDLFTRYCPRAIYPTRCAAGYDLLAGWEKSRVQTELINDLRVEGTPLQASVMAANDLLTYARIVRAYACYTLTLYPSTPDLWTATAVVYNAGPLCLSADGMVICEQGKRYLEMLK